MFATFDRVYSSVPGSYVPQDHFRLFMIFAISGVTRYRANLTDKHPYGYYLAALHWIDRIPIVGGADAIQNLLLVARFGMYYHVGISLWDISQSCMRQCVELDYHAESARLLTAFDEQKRRRIFWECYILDRYSSSMLGRPFAIADGDISAGIPAVANDETVRSMPALSHIEPPALQLPTELSVFVFCIRLRRISSRVRTDFYCVRKINAETGGGTPQQILALGRHRPKSISTFTSWAAGGWTLQYLQTQGLCMRGRNGMTSCLKQTSLLCCEQQCMPRRNEETIDHRLV